MRRLLSVLAAVALLLGITAPSEGARTSTPTQPTPGPTSGPTSGPCHYTPTPDEPAARPVSLPPDPTPTPSRGKVLITLVTNRGPIPLLLDRAQAPCTVQSYVHLARSWFYNWTTCHRLTAYPTLSVLQCGDPTGTGEGGPGYSFKDELPTDLPPFPTDPTGVGRLYARGVLAIANAGPDTNGSQFFLVYKDSKLRPDYTIFGQVLPIGLRTLDRIAAGGVAPGEDGSTTDGAPALTTRIYVAF